MHVGQSHDKPELSDRTEARRIFVDALGLTSLPWVLLFWIAGWARKGVKPLRIYYFGASPRAESVLRWLARLLPVRAEEAEYSIVELVDAHGASAWLQAWTDDLREICDTIRRVDLTDHPLIQEAGERFSQPQVLTYLEKCIFGELKLLMTHIRVVEWYRRLWQLDRQAEVVLFIGHGKPWLRRIAPYAAEHGVRLVGYGPPAEWRPGSIRCYLRLLWTVVIGRPRPFAPARSSTRPMANNGIEPIKIAVEYSGMGLTLDPSKRTDLFWLPAAKTEPGEVLVYFHRPDDPLDEVKRTSLREHGLECVAMNPRAAACDDVDVWESKAFPDAKALRSQLVQWLIRSVWRKPRHLGWLVPRLDALISQYSNWQAFFDAYNVKVHISFVDWPTERVAADMALSDLGGISVSYERTSEHFPSVFRCSTVDVHFAFGLDGVQLERQSGSYIAQYVSAGYNHDNSFVAVRDRARSLRERLESNGARFIICYLDENSGNDKRITVTHEEAAMNYAYLLEKLLDDTSLGFIFKPKKPATLRARLGPVAQLLDEALATGRCHLFDRGIVATDVLPNEASQAADVTIGLLVGSTAGLESALAGTPTLLLDRENLGQHPYYKWGRGSVVFEDLETLFTAVTAHRQAPASAPGLGDWSPVLDRLDPFRDGRAAERMGTYIRWLANGLNAGLSVDETLEQARQRYVTLWGADKVVDLRSDATAETQIDTAPGHGTGDISNVVFTLTTRKGSEERDD